MLDTNAETPQSLQLLFQLPNVQQSGNQSQASAVLTASPTQNQTITVTILITFDFFYKHSFLLYYGIYTHFFSLLSIQKSYDPASCQTTVIQPLQTSYDVSTANTTFVSGVIQHPCPMKNQVQVPPLCNQHSQQVQVATQTSQQTPVPKIFQSPPLK